MTHKEENAAIRAAYAALGKEALSGRGGFWVTGEGWRTLRKARQETGVDGHQTRRPRQAKSAWGDYATIVMLNARR